LPEPIKVISQQPPGGRCTLYALYASELESCLGLSKRIVHSDCRDAHGEGFPSLLLNGVVLKPSDGVILSPQDICAGLASAGIDLSGVPDLEARLEAIQERFLEGVQGGEGSPV
jgi:cystathionine gamma-synthase